MKRTNIKENQVVIAGYVGTVEQKSDTLVSVSIANKKGKDDTEWLNVAFTDPQEGKEGAKLATLAGKYIEKGQFLAVVATEKHNGEYTNYYAVAVELGPKKK